MENVDNNIGPSQVYKQWKKTERTHNRIIAIMFGLALGLVALNLV